MALYRGPMNMFGLGSGIAALIIGLNTLESSCCYGRIPGARAASERLDCKLLRVDVNTVTRKMLPYLWAVFSVILSGVLYF